MKEIEVKHIYDNVYTITAETIRTDGLIRDMADQGLYVTAIVVNPGLTFTYNVRYEPKEENLMYVGAYHVKQVH